jgi:hypothetical protein
MEAWELDPAEQWLKAFLVTAAGTADVYSGLRAGRDKPLFVSFRFVPELQDVTGAGAGNRLIARPKYDIEVVVLGGPTDASEAMVAAISDALKNGPWPITLSSGTQITMERRSAISRETPGRTAEEYFTHRGGSYQMWVA